MPVVDHGRVQVISASRSEWISPFTGLGPGQFRKLTQEVGRRGGDAIADGRPGRSGGWAWPTGYPTRDHRVAAPSKNYQYSINVQIAIDVDTRLVTAVSEPHPANRNDCTVYRDSGIGPTLAGRPVMADGGYQGNPQLIMPYRKRGDGQPLADWQEDRNTAHRKVRARTAHALARMNT